MCFSHLHEELNTPRKVIKTSQRKDFQQSRLKKYVKNPVYEPREDSFLLEKAVQQYAFGLVLDLGTGSGIQAIAAAKSPRVEKVIAADISPQALEVAKENAANQGVENKITFLESDLFSAIANEKFDTIVSNPPYLPANEEERVDDVALESGESGRDFTERLSQEFEAHLKPNGIMLLLQSTVSNWEQTKASLEENGFSVEITGRKKFFFEQLVVLKAAKKQGL